MKNKIALIAIFTALAVTALGFVLSPYVRAYLKERHEKNLRETFVADYVKTCTATNPSEKRTAFCECVAIAGVKKMAVTQLGNKDYVNQYLSREITPACGAILVLGRKTPDQSLNG